MTACIANDWQRGAAVIRDLRLRSPHDPVGQFRIPKGTAARQDLADVIYDLSDQWAARAIHDGPAVVVTWDPNAQTTTPRQHGTPISEGDPA